MREETEEVQEEVQEGRQEEAAAVPDDMLQAGVPHLKWHTLYNIPSGGYRSLRLLGREVWSMTHAVSQQTKARAAELKRVETTKDDYGFSLTTALPRARAQTIYTVPYHVGVCGCGGGGASPNPPHTVV